MQWTPQQDAALKAVTAWMRNGTEPVFRLFGYAGTGKTTLARHLAASCGGKVLFAAYTGKAALVMKKNGCVGAQTIHSLIYQPYEASDALERIGQIKERLASWDDNSPESMVEYKRLQRELDELTDSIRSPYKPKPQFILRTATELDDADLLVIDECSMVNEEMALDLLSFGVRILVLGDPAQLPPVGGEGYFTKVKPDVMLTDVQRQAKDNPIIQLATTIREGRMLSLGEYGSSCVTNKIDAQGVLDHSQVIVGYNNTRKGYNRRIRALLEMNDPLPLAGDRIICVGNAKKEGLLNGSMWDCLDQCEDAGPNKVILHQIKSHDDGRVMETVVAHKHFFTGEEVKLSPWEWREAREFDYGYAITCHKSQGSQWDSVLIFDESQVARECARNWLYTAITRAQDRVTIFRR